ncbi:MAG: transposase [Planctomycetes bacterium]|nr:transposase [Planctomycetota bacterium]
MSSSVEKRRGANLPHWTAEGATYSVTFRLADAVTAEAASRLQHELADLEKVAAVGGELPLLQQVRLARLRSDAVDKLLNAGHGECLLGRPGCAEIASAALKHFDGQRYRLLAWAIMPNHVHVLFTPLLGFRLPSILHSWKSFTANRINRLLNRSGPLWQPESYDHLIRDRADLMHHLHYIRENPAKAGLRDWPWVG